MRICYYIYLWLNHFIMKNYLNMYLINKLLASITKLICLEYPCNNKQYDRRKSILNRND